MKRETLSVLLISSFLIILSGCFHYLALYDGTYRGRIVDANTGEPIEGVVVLGIWYKQSFLWTTDTVDTFYDAGKW